MRDQYKIPNYIKILVKDNPKITSGRKNFIFYQWRIAKTIDLVKKYIRSKKI